MTEWEIKTAFNLWPIEKFVSNCDCTFSVCTSFSINRQKWIIDSVNIFFFRFLYICSFFEINDAFIANAPLDFYICINKKRLSGFIERIKKKNLRRRCWYGKLQILKLNTEQQLSKKKPNIIMQESTAGCLRYTIYIFTTSLNFSFFFNEHWTLLCNYCYWYLLCLPQ